MLNKYADPLRFQVLEPVHSGLVPCTMHVWKICRISDSEGEQSPIVRMNVKYHHTVA